MIKYLFYFCVVLLLSSCEPSNEKITESALREQTFTEFPVDYALRGRRVGGTKDIPGRVRAIWMLDSIMVIYDYTASNGYYFNVFAKLDYTLLSSFGRPGYGPGEGAMPGDAVLDISHRRIVQHMQEKSMLYSYHIDSAIVLAAKYIPQVEQRAFSDSFVQISPTHYYALSNVGNEFNVKDNSYLRVIDRNTRQTILKGRRFSGPGFINSDVSMMFNLTSAVALRDDGKRAALAFYRWKRLAFVDVGSDSTTIVVKAPGETEPLKDKDGKIMDGVLTGYTDITEVGDLVFSSPYSKPVFDQEGKYHSDNYPKSIQIFDWNGNPLVELQLDAHVTRFAVDEKRKLLISFDPTSLQPIVEYDLSPVKELAKIWEN